MATDLAKPKTNPAQMLQDLAQLTARQLDAVMQRAAALRLQKRKRVLPPRESDLLRIINRGLSPEKSDRLEALQQKLGDETITRPEQTQLHRLTDELERLGAERLQALMELAALRKTTVSRLMNEMGLIAAAHA